MLSLNPAHSSSVSGIHLGFIPTPFHQAEEVEPPRCPNGHAIDTAGWWDPNKPSPILFPNKVTQLQGLALEPPGVEPGGSREDGFHVGCILGLTGCDQGHSRHALSQVGLPLLESPLPDLLQHPLVVTTHCLRERL